MAVVSVTKIHKGRLEIHTYADYGLPPFVVTAIGKSMENPAYRQATIFAASWLSESKEMTC